MTPGKKKKKSRGTPPGATPAPLPATSPPSPPSPPGERSSPAPVAGSVMPAGEFKTHCLRVMEEVAEYHLDVLITKHGRPVARLVPVEDEIPDSFGSLEGTVAYGDTELTAPDFEAWNGADS
jgi:prevent-host-death family protein